MPGPLEELASDCDDVAEPLPPCTRDEQRSQVCSTYIRDVYGELLSVHEPVDRVPLRSPAHQHRDQHPIPWNKRNPWHNEKPIAWSTNHCDIIFLLVQL